MTEKLRLPDLWLKMELALALVPPGTQADRTQNAQLAGCVRSVGATASSFNKWKAGDDALNISDAYFLAATLECLLHKGVIEPWKHETIKTYAAEPSNRLILEHALLEPIGRFGEALLAVIAQREDFEARGGETPFRTLLNNIIRQRLLYDLNGSTQPGGKVALLHGETRNWFVNTGDSERISRRKSLSSLQPPLPEVAAGHFIQYLLPPSPVDQLVLGYEAQDGDWIGADVADRIGWIAPRIHKAGKAHRVLDEPHCDEHAYTAQGSGLCRLQIVSLNLDHLSTTGMAPASKEAPHDLYRLTQACPDWPEGYAQIMALATYVRRLHEASIKQRNRAVRYKANGETTVISLNDLPEQSPLQARLYQLDYQIIP